MTKLKCNIGEYGIVVNQQGRFLILSLPINKEFTQEAWMLPGGRLDVNDQPEDGLKREVFEETGLKIKVMAPVHTARWGNEKPPKYAVFFLCRSVGKQKVILSREHNAYKWIKFGDIEKIPWHNLNSKTAAKKAKKLSEEN